MARQRGRSGAHFGAYRGRDGPALTALHVNRRGRFVCPLSAIESQEDRMHRKLNMVMLVVTAVVVAALAGACAAPAAPPTATAAVEEIARPSNPGGPGPAVNLTGNAAA